MRNYPRPWSFRAVLLLSITKPKWKYGCTTMLLLEKHMFLQINKSVITRTLSKTNTDSKVHGANMGPTWVLSAPDGPMLSPWTLLSGNECRHLPRSCKWSKSSTLWSHVECHLYLYCHRAVYVVIMLPSPGRVQHTLKWIIVFCWHQGI